MRNASRRQGVRSSIFFTMKLCLVTGIVMPVVSTSWKLSRPRREASTLPVIKTTGMESINAEAMPVTRLVEPGPEVARQTPVFPLARA